MLAKSKVAPKDVSANITEKLGVALTESEDTNKASTDMCSSSKKQKALMTKASPVSQKKVELAEAVLKAAETNGHLTTPAKEKPTQPLASNLLQLFKKESPQKGAVGLS